MASSEAGVCMSKKIRDFTIKYWDNSYLKQMLCSECKPEIEKELERKKYEIEIDLVVKFIESQPGDATKYSYFVYREGYDNFHFMPKDNTFKYPQRLSYWDVKDLDVRVPHEMSGSRDVQQEIIDLAIKHDCNPYTIKECIRTMKEIVEKSENEKNIKI